MHGLAALIVSTLVAAGPAMVGPAESAPGDMASARLEVDLSERQLYVYNNGSLMNTFPVAVGTDAHPTPRGTFTIDRLIWNPGWVPPDSEWARNETRKAPDDPDNPMRGVKIFFKYPAYYLHGTNAPGTVGSAASHGCLRMNTVDAENLAQFVQQAGGATRSDAWYRRIRASDTDTEEIRLPHPVTIEIHG